MKKTYFTKKGKSIHAGHVKRKDGRLELNPGALSPAELFEQCGLYTFEPQSQTSKNGKPKKNSGKLIFNDITGTCTHELIELSEQEIAAREEQQLRAQFEQEQYEKEEKEREEKIKAWKAEKEAEKQAKKEKKSNN